MVTAKAGGVLALLTAEASNAATIGKSRRRPNDSICTTAIFWKGNKRQIQYSLRHLMVYSVVVVISDGDDHAFIFMFIQHYLFGITAHF